MTKVTDEEICEAIDYLIQKRKEAEEKLKKIQYVLHPEDKQNGA